MIAALLVVAASLSTVAPPPAREFATREWHFDVSLDGRPIGEHRFTLRDGDGWREVTSEARFRVKLLFIEAYRYDHRAIEHWQGDCLEHLRARTDANGKAVAVVGRRASGEFRLESGEVSRLEDDCVQTFAYWNPRILDARRLLNPQTGEYVDVSVLLMGEERLDGHDTRRYRLIGRGGAPLEIDLWYTPAHDWVALEVVTPEGRRLRYARK